MKKNKYLYPFFILIFIAVPFHSQPVEKLKFKKDPSLIYFFQKGVKSDTLHKNAENIFYLVVPDTLKKNFIVTVENGQLLPTTNDSLVRLNYLPGFKYESIYLAKENTAGKKAKTEYEFKTLVDGISILPHTKISVSLVNKSTGGLILENAFIYAE